MYVCWFAVVYICVEMALYCTTALATALFQSCLMTSIALVTSRHCLSVVIDDWKVTIAPIRKMLVVLVLMAHRLLLALARQVDNDTGQWRLPCSIFPNTICPMPSPILEASPTRLLPRATFAVDNHYPIAISPTRLVPKVTIAPIRKTGIFVHAIWNQLHIHVMCYIFHEKNY